MTMPEAIGEAVEVPPDSKRDILSRWLADRIRDGAYGESGQLPTESALADQFGYNRTTVRAALQELAHAGLIDSIRGHGWYCRPDTRREWQLQNLDQRNRGQDVWTAWLSRQELDGDTALGEVWVGEPPKHVRDHLGLDDGEECATRPRLRYVGDQVWMRSTAYFPERYFHGAGFDNPLDMKDPSPLGLLRQLGAEPVHNIDKISARAPTADEAEELGIPRGTPAITACRTSRDAQNRWVRCTADVMAGHRFYIISEHDEPRRDC